MLKPMFTKTLLPVSLVVALGAANSALAADVTARHHKHTIVNSQTSKTKTDNGYSRTTTRTDNTGATATHRTDVTSNKTDGTRTTKTSGTTFDGKSYSGETVSHKTATGYTSQGHMITANGKVVDRSVNATIDKNANTITKEISETPQNGETKTRTVVHPLKKSR